MAIPEFAWRPLTPDRWADFETLFGKSGAYGGCWCMWFRQTGAEYSANRGRPNRDSMCAIVDSGAVPGLLGYVDGAPAAWVSLGPREVFPRLERSRAARAIDAAQPWSIVCFYIGKGFRRQGLMRRMVDASVEWAASQGATLLEAYPKDLEAGPVSAGAGYVGLMPAFVAAGFTEIARHVKGRPLMRRSLP
jgi:GNAT superfamily N-acetyltransferase